MSLQQNQLRIVNAVIEEGSYSAAARRLNVSQPAVSQAIRKLQDTFKVSLFKRRGRHLVPTDLCLELSQFTFEAQQLENKALRLLQKGDTLEKGSLRIGLGNSMPGMALIGEFKKRFPKVQIDVILGNHSKIVDNVLEYNVDVGILPNPPLDGRFFHQTCLQQQVVALVQSGHPLIGAKVVSLTELLKFPLVFRSKGSSTQRVVDDALRRSGLTVIPELTMETRDGVCEAVANGLGIGFMWNHGTSRQNGIVQIPVEEMSKLYDEVVFSRTDSQSPIIEGFYQSVAKTSRFHR